MFPNSCYNHHIGINDYVISDKGIGPMHYIIQPTVDSSKCRKRRDVDDGRKANRARHVTRRKGKRGPHKGIVQLVFEKE